jgi:hypothetical protein
VIDSLSLRSVWANLDGCLWWNSNLVLGGDLMMLVVKLMEVYFGSSWLMPWAEL